MNRNSQQSAADRAYNEDLVRLVGRAGDKPGKRMAAEMPRSTKIGVWGAGLILAAAAGVGIFKPGGSIDADNPVNGGLKPVAEHAVPDAEVPTPTTIIKVQPGDTVSEIAHALQQSGLEGDKDLEQIQEEIYQANPEEYRTNLPYGADLVAPIVPPTEQQDQ